jgi:hypothetical protein
MKYILIIIAIAFIWFILSKIGKGYYEAREESQNPAKYRLKKLLHQYGLDDFYKKFVCDPRFDSDHKFREQALNTLESLLEFSQSQATLENFEEKWSKMTDFSSLEESEKAFRERLEFHRKRLQAKREAKKRR